MSERISCPNCDHEFELSGALASELRKDLERELAAERKKHQSEFLAREAKLKEKEALLAQQASNAQEVIAKQLAEEREKLKSALAIELQEKQGVEFKALQEDLEQAKKKLKESHEHELILRKERSELAAQKEALKIDIARKEDELRKSLEEELKKRFSQEQELKLADKNNLINSLRDQIDDLKKRSEQGSQQAQGETLEVILEQQLGAQFPFDTIEPVAKGMRGSDVVHRVADNSGSAAGTIIWESKRTKNWSNEWLPKLRDDQRAAKAEFAVLVSVELPKGITTFGLVDNVWVCSMNCVVPLATALRETLLRTAQARQASDGQQGKMELLYSYLAGPEFRQRLEGIAETFENLRQDLEREKRAMQSIWSKREKQLERAVVSASGLHGDLQGIIGAGLEGIEYFALESIAKSDESS